MGPTQKQPQPGGWGRRAGVTHPGGVPPDYLTPITRLSSTFSPDDEPTTGDHLHRRLQPYYGLLEAGLGSSRWLDLTKLGRSLLKPGQQLTLTRYFTTRVKGEPVKARRQALYVDALTTRGGIEVDFGHFLSRRVTCHSCGHHWTKSEEKKTDVNIAVRMLEDAYDDRFDTAIVISGDSDLATPVATIRTRFPHKRVLVAFPPKRYSHELRRVADATFRIFNRNIRTSHLPAAVTTTGGTTLTVNPPGFSGDSIGWEIMEYGKTNNVFTGGSGAGCPDGVGASGGSPV